MYTCRNCGRDIKNTDMGWVHVHPQDPYDPRVCSYEPVYASPVLA